MRKLTRKEKDLLKIADRLERVADDLERLSRVDIHRKNGHIGYLRCESSLIRNAIGVSE